MPIVLKCLPQFGQNPFHVHIILYMHTNLWRWKVAIANMHIILEPPYHEEKVVTLCSENGIISRFLAAFIWKKNWHLELLRGLCINRVQVFPSPFWSCVFPTIRMCVHVSSKGTFYCLCCQSSSSLGMDMLLVFSRLQRVINWVLVFPSFCFIEGINGKFQLLRFVDYLGVGNSIIYETIMGLMTSLSITCNFCDCPPSRREGVGPSLLELTTL